MYSAENEQKNNGHTIQRDCVTVFISVVLPAPQALPYLLLLVLNGSLRGGEAGDGDTERGAGHIVQTHAVAELHAGGVAAVLAADAEVQVRARRAAELAGHVHELTDAGLVELGERVVLVDLLVIVRVEDCLLYTSDAADD